MKQFDPASIKTRFIQSLTSYADWSQVITDSAVDSLGTATTEPLAEVVRYFEYLHKEAKWKRAKNLSSMITGATFLGYTPRRKISAMGTLVISHDSTIQQAGIANIFGIEDLTTYLTPYAGAHSLITKGTAITLSDGSKQFIVTEDVSYDPGDFYVLAPVIQGVPKTFSVTAKGNPFEQIWINSSQVESASNTVSAGYFSISITPAGSATSLPVTIVEDVYVADSTLLACAVSSASDYSSVILTFGNGIAGSLIPAGASVNVSYLETLGSKGNVNVNYTVNKFASLSSFFCSNIPSTSNLISGILGGRDENTVDEIRGNAPVQYLLDGAVVTTSAYKTTIENIPGVNVATVYSGSVTNPVSGVVQNSIIYSAVDTTGSAPDLISFPLEVKAQLKGRNSPLDVVNYSPPLFLHMRTNISAISTLADQSNLSDLVANIQSDIASRYDILKQSFQQPFDRSALVSYISKNYSVTNVEPLVEAIVDLAPSSFTASLTKPGMYSANFSFDRSFRKLRGFQDGVLHCLKINIVFDCPECSFNGNSYSRTLFLIQDTNTAMTYSGTFTMASPIANGTTSTIQVCGVSMLMNSSQVSSAITFADALYTKALAVPAPTPQATLSSLTCSTSAGAKSITRSAGSWVTDGVIAGNYITLTGFANAGNNATYLVSSVSALTLTLTTSPGGADESLRAGVGAIVYPALSALYTFNEPSPGVISITPKTTGIAPPSLIIPTSSTLTGVTINFASALSYKMVQYPLITSITNYAYMQDSVLNPLVGPNEIVSTDTSTPYIPFQISFDYSSLNPSDLTVVGLGSGTLSIPQFMPGSSSTNYINFGASPTLLDSKIRIQVLAEPFDPNIIPYYQNNILKIVQDGVTDDVIVEVTNA